MASAIDVAGPGRSRAAFLLRPLARTATLAREANTTAARGRQGSSAQDLGTPKALPCWARQASSRKERSPSAWRASTPGRRDVFIHDHRLAKLPLRERSQRGPVVGTPAARATVAVETAGRVAAQRGAFGVVDSGDPDRIGGTARGRRERVAADLAGAAHPPSSRSARPISSATRAPARCCESAPSLARCLKAKPRRGRRRAALKGTTRMSEPTRCTGP